MHTKNTEQRRDLVGQLAFFGAKYSLIFSVFATMGYSLSSLA
ncbi:hypothetical protein [Spongiibacter pelagi]|nr:hypothetical protein [Spongiibacter pelagi]